MVSLFISQAIGNWGPVRSESLVLSVVTRAQSEVGVSLTQSEALFGGDHKSDLAVFLTDKEIPALSVYHVLR